MFAGAKRSIDNITGKQASPPPQRFAAQTNPQVPQPHISTPENITPRELGLDVPPFEYFSFRLQDDPEIQTPIQALASEPAFPSLIPQDWLSDLDDCDPSDGAVDLRISSASQHPATSLLALEEKLAQQGVSRQICLITNGCQAPISFPRLKHVQITTLKVESSDGLSAPGWLSLVPNMPLLGMLICDFYHPEAPTMEKIQPETCAALLKGLAASSHPLKALTILDWDPEAADCEALFEQFRQRQLKDLVLVGSANLPFPELLALPLESLDVQVSSQIDLDSLGMSLSGKTCAAKLILRDDPDFVSAASRYMAFKTFAEGLKANRGLQSLVVTYELDLHAQARLIEALFENKDIRYASLPLSMSFSDLLKTYKSMRPEVTIEWFDPALVLVANLRIALEKRRQANASNSSSRDAMSNSNSSASSADVGTEDQDISS